MSLAENGCATRLRNDRIVAGDDARGAYNVTPNVGFVAQRRAPREIVAEHERHERIVGPPILGADERRADRHARLGFGQEFEREIHRPGGELVAMRLDPLDRFAAVGALLQRGERRACEPPVGALDILQHDVERHVRAQRAAWSPPGTADVRQARSDGLHSSRTARKRLPGRAGGWTRLPAGEPHRLEGPLRSIRLAASAARAPTGRAGIPRRARPTREERIPRCGSLHDSRQSTSYLTLSMSSGFG